MTGPNHVLTGTAIALALKKPELAIPCAFLSHFATDMLPHFHSRKISAITAKRIAGVEVVLSVAIAIVVAILSTKVAAWVVLTCALAAVAPDLVWLWRYNQLRNMDKMFIEPLSVFSRWHIRIQWSESQKGIIIEIFWFILMVYLIIHLR